MKKTLTYFLLTTIISGLFILCSCDKGGKTNYTFPDGGDKEEPKTGYPTGLTVKEFTQTFGDGKKCIGYYVVADTKANPKLKFNPVHQTPAKKPSSIHSEFLSKGKGTPYITINGGYFWSGASLSLLISDAQVRSVENQMVTRKDASNNNVNVYAVRSAFGQKTTGDFEVKWIYCVTDKANAPYSFLTPLGNDEKTKTYMPSPPTSATAGASAWTPQQAIGGGPTLVKDGVNVAVDSYWKEVFDGGGIAGTSRQPRTAIGATNDGKLILIVCDGRGMNDSAGYTLSELAEKFIELGAKNAINLDGGGSSAIVGHDGKVLNKPSDANNVERSVPTAVVISEIK